jgi:preprotein translocase SecE subunit
MNYLKGALYELRNVTWPTEKETFKLTRITVLFVFVFTVMFFFTDFVLSGMFNFIYSL